jgi:hypothetical protein
MKLKQLSEVIWEFYDEGRQKTSALTFSKKDIQQYVILGVGSKFYVRYYQAKKMDGEKDYYFYSADLTVKQYDLGDPSRRNVRRVDFGSKDEFIKLPHNEDITNVYPVGNKCKGDTPQITQVAPGEENFYLGPEFSDFSFFVEKGRGLDFYNVPPCVNKMDVERVWITDNMDISFDMGYDIANEVLGIVLKEKQFAIKTIDNPYNPKPIELRRKLEEQQTDI